MKIRMLLTRWISSVLLISLLPTFLLTAQNPKRANIWYFGDQAGLDFSQGHPVPLTDGAMSAFEGSAVMSNEQGQLLFYTNGGDLPYSGGVWNSNHQLMPNGDLNGTGGCSSSLQSSLIIPHPKYENVFYLFTTDCIENNSQGGLRYSIIDMNLDGGLGDVVVKSQLLTTPVDESLTAIRHANGKDYWIVSHKIHTDSFYVYHLTTYGITGLVKSKAGEVTPDYAGTLVAAANGEKLVYSGLNFTTMFNFNSETGEITDPLDLGIPSYSACFSPNCELLYVANGVNKELYQFDLMADDIPSSVTWVGGTASTGFGSMQLGPNGRIYVARFVTSDYLGVIKNPNYRGEYCEYVDDGIYLNGRYGKGGLPNFSSNIVGECLTYPEDHGVQRGDLNLNLRHHDVTSHHFTATWGSNNERRQQEHRVLLRKAGEPEWEVFLVNGNSKTFNDLDPETTYEIKVLPHYAENPNYQYLDDHFTEDVIQENGKAETAIQGNKLKVTTLEEFEFDLYPNPAVNTSTIAINMGDQPATLDIVLMQTNGKIIQEFNFDNISGFQNFTISTEDLTNGIYQVAVQSQENYQVKKLIVMK